MFHIRNYFGISITTVILYLVLPYCRNAGANEASLKINNWPAFLNNPSHNAVCQDNKSALKEKPSLLWKITSSDLIDHDPDKKWPLVHPGGFELRPRTEFSRSLSVANGLVFATGRDSITAYSVLDGRIKYKVDIHGSNFSTATWSSDRLFLADGEGDLHCLDAATGNKLWSDKHNKKYGYSSTVGVAPLIHRGKVFFPAGSNGIKVLSAKDGKLHCSYIKKKVRVKESDSRMTYRSGRTTLSFQDGVVYAVISNSVFVAINADSCNLQWEYKRKAIPASKEAYRIPVVSEDSIYIAQYPSRYRNLLSVIRSNGKKRWSIDDDFTTMHTPVIAGGIIYISHHDIRRVKGTPNAIVAYTVKSGGFLWKIGLGKGRITPPVVHGDMIYVAEKNRLIGINRIKKKVEWSFELEDEVSRSLAVYNGTVFIVDRSGNLYAIGRKQDSIRESR